MMLNILIMDIFDKNSIKLFEKRGPEIMEEASKAAAEKFSIYEPSQEERDKLTAMVMDFIKKKKLKLYGGYALHMAMINVSSDPDACIYKADELKTPDLDFYTPEPVKDMYELCNQIFEAGFEDTVGAEAQHAETYSVFVNGVNYADLSYVPRNVYHRIPFIDIDGLFIVHPHFALIDNYRQFNDPMTSFWRLEKVFARTCKTLSYYPLKEIRASLKIPFDPKTYKPELMDIIRGYLTTNTIMTIGFTGYNMFVRESGIKNSKQHKHIKEHDVPYIEIISIDFQKDATAIYELLKSTHKDDPDGFSLIEYYRFFQYYDRSCTIYYHDVPLVYIYDNNKKCFPFIEVPVNKILPNNKDNDAKKEIQVGTFDMHVMMFMILSIRYRVMDEKNMMIMYNGLVSHMIQIRNYYFGKTGKTLYDDTVFRAFVVDCMGTTIPPKIKHNMEIKKRLKEKKPAVFRYKPRERIQTTPPNFHFANSSGNPIKNDKNKTLGV
jgi:hypothetical protein